MYATNLLVVALAALLLFTLRKRDTRGAVLQLSHYGLVKYLGVS